MKKIYGVIITFFLLFIPLSMRDVVYAGDTGIGKFYMDATIQENGDIIVKELFSLNGEYNGSDRVVNYQNSSAKSFNTNSSSFGGSSIHNGSGVFLRKIGAGDRPISFDDLKNSDIISAFIEQDAVAGDYGYYTKTPNIDGEHYRIYNPSSMDKAFYIEYDLQNMGVVHNDVAEIGWNIFNDDSPEAIEDFELLIHLPNNKDELRAWAHGPLNGNIEIIDKQTVKVTISNLSSNTAMDVRLVFDKSVINGSTKVTNTEALSKILVYESEKAEEANQIRKTARFQYYGTIALVIIWFIGLVVLVIRTYYKHDKEYKSGFDGKYYREFPADYGPETLGYLMNKTVSTNELSASILNLVYKKVISVEKVPYGKNGDYEFTYHPDMVEKVNLTTMESELIAWLFEGTPRENPKLLLSEFKRKAKNSYSDFLDSYNSWTKAVTKDAIEKNFYEDKTSKKTFSILYTLIGVILIMIISYQIGAGEIGSFCFLIGLIALIYFFNYKKRTKNGNEDYTKWKAFKNFLVDFGNFNEKELPELILWEKYLVYAVTLGCASKLAKTMEVKAAEYYPNMDTYYPGYHFNYVTSLNRAINNGVSSAVSTAVSTKSIAESSRSSSGGHGGGFSSGGGSFGGGGSVGRF